MESKAAHQKIRRMWRVGIVTAAVLGMGVTNIVSALSEPAHERFALVLKYLPLEVHQGTRTLSVLAGLMLIFLSQSLFRRKRWGWIAAFALMTITLFLHIFKGLNYEEALFSLAVLAILLYDRRDFVARSDPYALKDVAMYSMAAALGAFLYGILGFYLLRHQFYPDFSLSNAIRTTIQEFALSPNYPLAPKPHHWQAYWFLDSLVAVAFAAAFYIAVLILRPVTTFFQGKASDRDAALSLLKKFGGSSISYWVTYPGLAYYWSASKKSAIAYKLVNGIAIVLGDPIGNPSEFEDLLDGFDAMCRVNDWLYVWYQVTPAILALARERGALSMKIGEEALIDLPGITFAGKTWKDARTAAHRMEREGYRAVWYDLAKDPLGWLGELDAISKEWMTGRGEEKGFSVTTWVRAKERAADQRFIVLENPEGRPDVLLSFVPVFGRDQGWMLDLIRKRKNAVPGSVDYLIGAAVEKFRDEGAGALSLSLSPLSDVVPDEASDSPELVENVKKLIYEHFKSFYNFDGLKRWKEKYRPRWEPRYVVYPSLAVLPKAVLALIRAHSGISFVDLGREFFARNRPKPGPK